MRDDPLEDPAEADPEFAEVEAAPLAPTDVPENAAIVFARAAGAAP